MVVPTSEVSYTSAIPGREDHEVYKDMWHWTKKKKIQIHHFNPEEGSSKFPQHTAIQLHSYMAHDHILQDPPL